MSMPTPKYSICRSPLWVNGVPDSRHARVIPGIPLYSLRAPADVKTHTSYLTFNTKKRQEIIDITDEVDKCRADAGITEGFVLVSAMHISASVFVNDHEPGLWQDILDWLEERIAPWSPDDYRHNSGTGEDNAAAHLRSLTIGHEVIVPVTKGRLDFGPWQRVFYGEWDGQRKKRVLLKAMGE